MEPEVSVYMIVYNGASFVARAVDRILGQTFEDLELVVVDDGSTDETPEILAGYRDPRLRLIRQSNVGRPRARNRALAECRGRFIAIIDADDLAIPERITRQVEYLKRHPEVGVVTSDYDVIDGKDRILWTAHLATTTTELRRQLRTKNPILNSSAMFRREVVDAIGPYDPELPYCQDHDFWIRAVSRFPIANIPEVLAAKRLHNKMIMMTINQDNARFAMKVRKRAIRLFHLPWYYHVTYFHLWLMVLLPQQVMSVLLKMRWWMLGKSSSLRVEPSASWQT